MVSSLCLEVHFILYYFQLNFVSPSCLAEFLTCGHSERSELRIYLSRKKLFCYYQVPEGDLCNSLARVCDSGGKVELQSAVRTGG